MSTKGLWIVIAIIIAGVVTWLVMRGQPAVAPGTTNTGNVTNTNSEPARSFTTGEQSTNSTSLTATVTITAAGLSPTTVTVKAGARVTFRNQDSSTHQISSDPHPTHTDLPGFDQLVAAGGDYSFTFRQAGSWGFHDHLRPTDSRFQGTVVVQP
ncbi:MAG: cupredoxin domain-containing protein [Candidatus Kerfeldbacteria bacterium]|nr:cupredoxin domain-containing protein [Candidatus Kerfeldbacteria bacterium]